MIILDCLNRSEVSVVQVEGDDFSKAICIFDTIVVQAYNWILNL